MFIKNSIGFRKKSSLGYLSPFGYSRRKSVNNSFTAVLFAANILSLVPGVFYINSDNPGIVWNTYGLLMILTLIANLYPVLGTKIRKPADILYLLLFNSGMLLVPVLNLLSSSSPTDQDSISILSVVVILAIYLFGGAVCAVRLFGFQLQSTESAGFSAASRNRFSSLFITVVQILASLVLLSGLYLSYDLLGRNGAFLMEVFIPQLSLFWGMFYLGTACLIVRLNRRNKRRVYGAAAMAVGIAVFVVCLFPLCSVPGLIADAEKSYQEAFGSPDITATEKQSGNPAPSSNSFLRVPFSIPGYFFGLPSKPYQVKENVLFYEGTEGVDKGLKLYCDVYTPPDTQKVLPGGRSVLVRIHGGAWTIGDKGAANFAQVNKFFANRGYVVFDIQYGLNNGKKFIDIAEVPEHIRGAFTVDDMVRHTGIFMKYLAEHGQDYNANLNSVFLSGGSAGGQLTLAAGLAATGGKYKELFDDRLTIRGLIPFYPANGLADNMGIGGTRELSEPSMLLEENSPPSLIYQGTCDGLVNPQIAERFRQSSLAKGNSRCALLLMPYASHGSDSYFSGYYNQVFLYYMERFMYKFK